MKNWCEELRADALRLRIVILQWLNGVAITLGAIVVWVHATYPGIEQQLLGALPPKLQLLVMGLFGLSVHMVARAAKKAGQP